MKSKLFLVATLISVFAVLPVRADITPAQRAEIQSHLDKAHKLMAGDEPNVLDAVKECTQAIDLASRITDLGPNLKSVTVDAHRYRGEAHKAFGEWKKAVADFDAALKINPNDVESLIGRGEADMHINKGLFSDVKEDPEVEPLNDFAAAIKLDPKSAHAYVARGKYFQIGFSSDDKENQALAEYDKATQVDPNYAEGWFQHAKVLSHRADPELLKQAKSDFDRAIALRPKAEYFSDRGTFLMKSPPHDYPAIIADFTSAIIDEPSNPKHYSDRADAQRRSPNPDKIQMMADYSKAINLLKSKKTDLDEMAAYGATDKKSERDAENALGSALQQRGDFELANGDPRAAIGDFNAALQLDAGNDDAIAGRVRILTLAGRSEMAINEASARIAIVRSGPLGINRARNLLAARAGAFFATQHYDEALIDLNQAIESDSVFLLSGDVIFCKKSEWYFNRALVWQQKKDNVHALADLNVACKLNPAYVEQIKGTQFEQSLSPCDPDAKILINNGDTAILHKLMGNEWAAAGLPAKAGLELDKAITIDPDYADAYNNRGLAWLQLKNFEAAERDMDKAISLKSSDPRFYINRSTLHLYQHRAAEAVDDAKNATVLDAQNPLFWAALANAQELNSDYADAETSLNTELPLLTDRDAAKRVRGHLVLVRALQNKAPTDDDHKKLISWMSRDQRKSLLDATEAAIKVHPEIAALGELRVLIVAVNEAVKKQPMFIP